MLCGGGMFVGGMRPGMGRLRWPWCSAGCSTPCGGIGGAAATVGVEGLGCLRVLGGGRGDLAWFKFKCGCVSPWFSHVVLCNN